METMKDVLNALAGQVIYVTIADGNNGSGRIVKAGMNFVSVEVGEENELFYFRSTRSYSFEH